MSVLHFLPSDGKSSLSASLEDTEGEEILMSGETCEVDASGCILSESTTCALFCNEGFSSPSMNLTAAVMVIGGSAKGLRIHTLLCGCGINGASHMTLLTKSLLVNQLLVSMGPSKGSDFARAKGGGTSMENTISSGIMVQMQLGLHGF